MKNECLFVATGLEDGDRKEYVCSSGCRKPVWSRHPPEKVHRTCVSILQRVRRGPGTELMELMQSIGATEKPGCGCKSKAGEMNRLGSDGCRKNFDKIVDWLKEGASKYDLSEKSMVWARALKIGLVLNPLNPFPQLLSEAIRRSDASVDKHVLINFPHGLGDHVQLNVVLQHLAVVRPDLIIHVEGREHFHSVLRGISRSPCNQYDMTYDMLWPEPNECNAVVPSTKAERCLVDVFDIVPQPNLCKYHKYKWSGTRGSFALLHGTGVSSPAAKNLSKDIIGRVRETIESHGIDVVNVNEIRDVRELLRLSQEARFCIGIDSGPEHLWACTDTPAIICWVKHHPVHYFPPADNLLHLVPINHRELLRGGRTDLGESFFHSNYRHRVYGDGDLGDSIAAAVKEIIA